MEEVCFGAFCLQAVGRSLAAASGSANGFYGVKLAGRGAATISGEGMFFFFRDCAAWVDFSLAERVGTLARDGERTAHLRNLLPYIDSASLSTLNSPADPRDSALEDFGCRFSPHSLHTMPLSRMNVEARAHLHHLSRHLAHFGSGPV